MFFIIPECPNTEQFRTAGSWIKIGFDFYQLTEESNPGRLGEKRQRFAVPRNLTLLERGKTITKRDPERST